MFVLANGAPLVGSREVLLLITIALQALRRHPDDGKEIGWRRLG
jgi:hypothetical protein